MDLNKKIALGALGVTALSFGVGGEKGLKTGLGLGFKAGFLAGVTASMTAGLLGAGAFMMAKKKIKGPSSEKAIE